MIYLWINHLEKKILTASKRVKSVHFIIFFFRTLHICSYKYLCTLDTLYSLILKRDIWEDPPPQKKLAYLNDKLLSWYEILFTPVSLFNHHLRLNSCLHSSATVWITTLLSLLNFNVYVIFFFITANLSVKVFKLIIMII